MLRYQCNVCGDIIDDKTVRVIEVKQFSIPRSSLSTTPVECTLDHVCEGCYSQIISLLHELGWAPDHQPLGKE